MELGGAAPVNVGNSVIMVSSVVGEVIVKVPDVVVGVGVRGLVVGVGLLGVGEIVPDGLSVGAGVEVGLADC